jgi:hypothetical protein
MKINWSLCFGATLVAILDVVLCIQILAFIGYSRGGAGSARMWIATKIVLTSIMAVAFTMWAFRSYFAARQELEARWLFMARLPLVCLLALLVSYFVVLKFVDYLYTW